MKKFYQNTKLQNFKIKLILILISFTFIVGSAYSQRYSIDKPPQNKLNFHIHLKTLFKKNPQRKAERKAKKEEKKKSWNERKTEKKYWKHVDHPKEKGSDRRVVRRMKKNMKIAERHNHNKHTESKIKRLSRKKIKLPKISVTKLHWPWKKKHQE